MSYNIIFLSLADKDLQEAIDWYESQKYLLGWEFKESVITAIDKIIDDRVEYRIISNDIRKIKLSRFPFDIYYSKSIKEKEIVIWAVFNHNRDPNDIKDLLNQ